MLIQLLGSISGAGVVTAVVSAIINRRKMSADVTEVIQKAAGTAVERVEGDNARLRLELKELKAEHNVETESLRGANQDLWAKAREAEQENAMLIDAVRDQRAYAVRLAGRLRELGVDVEDPPSLPSGLQG